VLELTDILLKWDLDERGKSQDNHIPWDVIYLRSVSVRRNQVVPHPCPNERSVKSVQPPA
jgi:hypothetical protein